MIYLTQLIYVLDGQENVFEEFERAAIPIIGKYNGELMLRIRPDKDSLVEGTTELPYEVHFVRFPTQLDFDKFSKDEGRRRFLHLKESSVRETFVYQGSKV